MIYVVFLHCVRSWHRISAVIKFSVISRKRHYRKSMHNASRRIRTHLLETDNATFIRVNIKSPASFPEVLFPARKQSRRAVVVVTSFLQFPATCIDTASPLFRFPSRNRGESCVTGLYTRSICARSLRACTPGTVHVKTRDLPAYIFHYTMEKQATGCCTWRGKIGFIIFHVIFFWKRVSICMKH